MTAEAAGAFRRTELERSDQRVSWDRSDQAFFAAGACHVLAWVCRDTYGEQQIGIEALRFEGEQQVFHTYATWDGWTFDHSGWNPEPQLLAINTAFEGVELERAPSRLAWLTSATNTTTGCRTSTGGTPPLAPVPSSPGTSLRGPNPPYRRRTQDPRKAPAG